MKLIPAEQRSSEDQKAWANSSLASRLKIVKQLRRSIAENAESLAQLAASVSNRPIAEKLVSEVLPLADACRWLEKNATRVLSPRFYGRSGRPLWMTGVTFEVQRQPFGKVLVIGPGNYPLFLPAIHTLQALVAGNIVLLKPAPRTRKIALAFARLLIDAGLNPALLTILEEGVEAAQDAIQDGVDKVIFTGSSDNGRDVLSALTGTNTPSVMELSGEDPVIVLADADLYLVIGALRFGTRFNDGETCIAPRQIFVVEAIAEKFLALVGEIDLPVVRVPNGRAAVEIVNEAEFALGASIFSNDVRAAQKLAATIRTGSVVINDIIAPLADPRIPFGGIKASGFGVTRGEEGLLEMTFPHVVAVRHGKLRPHFEDLTADDAGLFLAYIRAAHGHQFFRPAREFVQAIIRKSKKTKTTL